MRYIWALDPQRDLQSQYSHFSDMCRLSESDPHTVLGKRLQVVVNDVARIVVRKRRSDHIRVEDLLKKAGLEGIN